MPEYKTEFLYLTTTGWKSGKLHEIEIWFVDYGACYYLCAEQREATHWVRNIQHNPTVTFWVNKQTFTGTGRALDPAAEPELAASVAGLFDQKYKWSDGLLVELCPNPEHPR